MPNDDDSRRLRVPDRAAAATGRVRTNRERLLDREERCRRQAAARHPAEGNRYLRRSIAKGGGAHSLLRAIAKAPPKVQS